MSDDTITLVPEFLYVTRPARHTPPPHDLNPAEQATLDRHFAYIEDLVQQGTALLAGQAGTNARGFELLIFRADDDEAAERLVLADPAIVEGLMTAELFPLEITLLSDTWER